MPRLADNAAVNKAVTMVCPRLPAVRPSSRSLPFTPCALAQVANGMAARAAWQACGEPNGEAGIQNIRKRGRELKEDREPRKAQRLVRADTRRSASARRSRRPSLDEACRSLADSPSRAPLFRLTLDANATRGPGTLRACTPHIGPRSTPPLAPSVPNVGPLCVARCAMILMLVAKSKHEPKGCDYRASRHTWRAWRPGWVAWATGVRVGGRGGRVRAPPRTAETRYVNLQCF